MKKLIALSLGLLLLLSLTAPALAENANTITVVGTASVSLPADMATLQLGAFTRAKTVAEATKQNGAIMQKVLQALKDLGIEDKDMVTTQYNVYSEVPYQEYGSLGVADPVYNVTNLIFVTVRDLSQTAQTIDAATQAGANQILSLTFGASKSQEAYDRALTRAVEDAANKAKVLAAASGKTLGALQSVSATDYYNGIFGADQRMEMMASEAKVAGIISGDVSVTANVTLIYGMD